MKQTHLQLTTKTREPIDITNDINTLITQHKIDDGLCHLFLKHTSAGLMISASKDENVLLDIEDYLQYCVPDKKETGVYRHENYPADMAGHLRSVLLGVEKTIPIANGKLNLGRLQAVYLYEFNQHPNKREIVISLF